MTQLHIDDQFFITLAKNQMRMAFIYLVLAITIGMCLWRLFLRARGETTREKRFFARMRIVPWLVAATFVTMLVLGSLWRAIALNMDQQNDYQTLEIIARIGKSITLDRGLEGYFTSDGFYVDCLSLNPEEGQDYRLTYLDYSRCLIAAEELPQS